MQNKVNLEQILKQYLTLETVRANNPNYTFNMILSAMKEACRQTLDLASENAKVFKIGYNEVEMFASVDIESIINTIKQVE
jgi:hypothetical protein